MRVELANLNHCAQPFLSRARPSTCAGTTIPLSNSPSHCLTSQKIAGETYATDNRLNVIVTPPQPLLKLSTTSLPTHVSFAHAFY